MTVGNGLIANGINIMDKNEKIVLFASGVSNSNETDILQFERERELLTGTIANNPNKTFIYISSCAVEDPPEDNPYYTHKHTMEELVKNSVKDYYIFRLPQVVGQTTNKNTLFNFLIDRISNHIPFDIWINATRNLIDVDDVNQIINSIIQKKKFQNTAINIASLYNCSILELVDKMEYFLGEKAIYHKIPKGHKYKIDTSSIEEIVVQLNLKFDEFYLDRLLQKYIYLSEKDKHGR